MSSLPLLLCLLPDSFTLSIQYSCVTVIGQTVPTQQDISAYQDTILYWSLARNCRGQLLTSAIVGAFEHLLITFAENLHLEQSYL